MSLSTSQVIVYIWMSARELSHMVQQKPPDKKINIRRTKELHVDYKASDVIAAAKRLKMDSLHTLSPVVQKSYTISPVSVKDFSTFNIKVSGLPWSLSWSNLSAGENTKHDAKNVATSLLLQLFGHEPRYWTDWNHCNGAWWLTDKTENVKSSREPLLLKFHST